MGADEIRELAWTRTWTVRREPAVGDNVGVGLKEAAGAGEECDDTRARYDLGQIYGAARSN